MEQLGFDSLLMDAETENRERVFARETAHLPRTLVEAIPFFRQLLDDHHAAMMAADCERVVSIRADARALALKLNNGEPGILAGADAPGTRLARENAAVSNAVPLWGQQGEFTLEVAGALVRIEMEGLFGIASSSHWLGFAVRAVDTDKPFISATGYRSFLGCHIEIQPGITVDQFCSRIIAGYVADQLDGRLIMIADDMKLA